MKIFKRVLSIFFLASVLLISCEPEEEDIAGCMDPLSHTFDSSAVVEDGSCQYYYGGRNMGQIDVGAVINTNNEYDIYIDDELIGRLLYYFPNGVRCGEPDIPGRVFEFGAHTVRAVGNGGTVVREGLINLEPQECLVVLVENLPLAGGGGGGGGGGNTGDIIFWTNQDFGCGQINVNVSGVGSSTISGSFNSTPNCSNTGSGGNFNNLTPGTYSYTASCSGLSWSGNFTITENTCKTFQLENSGGGGGGGGGNTGDIIFWINQDFGCGQINVNVSGVGSSTISGSFNSAPNCSNTGSGGNFNNLTPGTYSYTASCSGLSWSGTFTITENTCTTFELESSGGGGGGGNPGDIIFWINQDFGCGQINVNVSGVGSSTITGSFNSTPDCSNTGAGGNFNNLTPGNYSFSASCTGYTWNGNFTISENTCTRFQLYN